MSTPTVSIRRNLIFEIRGFRQQEFASAVFKAFMGSPQTEDPNRGWLQEMGLAMAQKVFSIPLVKGLQIMEDQREKGRNFPRKSPTRELRRHLEIWRKRRRTTTQPRIYPM